MTAIEKTAYPCFPQRAFLMPELEACYTPTEEELQFVQQYVRKRKAADSEPMQYQLNMLVQLKCFQQMGYFPKLKTIPDSIIQHISHKLNLPLSQTLAYTQAKMLYRHQQAIRQYLKVQPYQKTVRRLAIQTALESAHLHNYPADIINNVIEALIKAKYELPAFIQLDRLVKHVRYRANQKLFAKISQLLPETLKQRLDATLTKATRTEYHWLKQLPKSASISHFKELLAHHDWLLTFGSMLSFIEELSQIKRQDFAGEAKALDVGHIREMNPAKRYTLMVCLIHEMQLQAKDNLVLMLIKTLAKMHKRAKLKLTLMREQQEKKTQAMLGLLNEIAIAVTEVKTLESIEHKLNEYGGAEHVQADCETLLACHGDNYLPLLWQYFKTPRPVLIKLLRLLSIRSANQDDTLIQAMQHMLAHTHLKREFIPADCNLDFASKVWRKLILKKENNQPYLVKRHFEVCVFSYLADELHSTNVWVKGSASYPDFREHLLPWEACELLINDYCQNLQLPTTGIEAVKQLHNQLAKKAKQIDKQFHSIAELGLNDKGEPVLKRRKREKPEPELLKLSQAIKSRMPERNLIDILTNMQHYTGWANFFGPFSGNEPKLPNAKERYILTTFAYGTGMGPTQAAQHMKNQTTAHMLSWINCQHVTAKQQDQAMTSLINYYALFELAQHWGKGEAAAADGKLRKIYEENLIAEMHIRYGSKGGIAYHHIADNYIALFSTFIPCGVWEAVQIIEGLLKNKSVIQPKIVHGDTQAQSTVVFALAHLLGIQLMPRIRNWKDLVFYKANKTDSYKHLNLLFKETIDWSLIETHWQDMLQVVLSIKEGKLSSSALLRKLGTYSRRNKLYQALRELGRVIRTLFLLDYISDIELREEITAETNKVEAYNGFTDWISFGNPYTVIASNDPEEHEKAIKYTDIIANCVMLQNVIDISEIVMALIAEGFTVKPGYLTRYSPLLTEHIKRFGNYYVNLMMKPKDVSHVFKLPLP